MRNVSLISVLIVVLIAVIYYFFLPTKETNVPLSQTISATSSPASSVGLLPYSAKFAVYTLGTFRLFDDPKYHNQSDRAYIESSQVNTIVVTDPNMTWQEFFDTLPMKLEKSCLTTGTGQKFCNNETNNLKFYINGNLTSDALDRKINANDKLLVTFGPKDQNVSDQLEKLNAF